MGRSPHSEKTDPINEYELINFLAYDQARAYTLREIESQTSMSILEASRLSILEEQGIVRNRGDYWAISKDYSNERLNRVARNPGSHGSLLLYG